MYYNQRTTPPMALITRSASASGNNIDISKLRKVKEEKDKKRIKVYEEILKKCHQRIIKCASHEEDTCLYQVPEFCFGVPIYNLTACICFIIYKLRKDGLKVNYVYPNYLIISWKKSMDDEEKEFQLLTEDFPNSKEFMMPVNKNSKDYNQSRFKETDNSPAINPMLIYDNSTLESLKFYADKIKKG